MQFSFFTTKMQVMLEGTTRRLTLTVRGAAGAPVPLEELELTPAFTARYRLERELGRGASGMVWQAFDGETQRPVAIKFLMRLGDADRARFLQEGRLLARLAHPNIVALYEVGELGDHPYLVTALLDGGTLRDRLARKISFEEAVQIARDVLAGLVVCHGAGVVHRDLKPENVLFDTQGAARLADLGIARHHGSAERHTMAGSLIGTPGYMAPEQVRGEEAGTATDVHAVGLMLHEMVTGRMPFPQDSLADLLEAKTRPVPDLRTLEPAVPDWLAAAIGAATALRIADRPQTAAMLLARLDRGAPGARPAEVRPARRYRLAGPLMMLTAFSAAAVAVVYLVVTAPPRLISHEQELWYDGVSVKWKSDRHADAKVELWMEDDSAAVISIPSRNGRGTDHAAQVPLRRPNTRYGYRIVLQGRYSTSTSPPYFVKSTSDLTFSRVDIQVLAKSVVLAWTTSHPTDERLEYGPRGLADEEHVTRWEKSTAHRVELTGLRSGATYWYLLQGTGEPDRTRIVQPLVGEFTTAP